MKPVDPAELSAFLDGELSPERAEQVRCAIAEDSELRRVFEELSAVHRNLMTCAVAARFQPRISLAKSRSFPALGILGLALAMLILRLAVKLLPLGVGVAFQATALLLVLLWVFFCLVRLTHDEHWRIVGAEAPNVA
ncbi:MAG: anti-sigma factor [Planctomycetota bacterium]|jgi:anti-sigma factor RsiW